VRHLSAPTDNDSVSSSPTALVVPIWVLQLQFLGYQTFNNKPQPIT